MVIPKKHKRKFLIKLISLLILSGNAFAATTQQNLICLNIKNRTLGEVLGVIEKQSNYSFLVRSKDVNMKEIVSIEVRNKPINEVLKILFNQKQISYEISGNNISIFKPQHKETEVSTGRKINGLITDSEGEPLIGATILEKGSKNGTVTDRDGLFTMTASEQSILMISHIGHLSIDQKVGFQTFFKITLEEDVKLLDELVVIGYGTMKMRDLTGSVSTIRSSQIENEQYSSVQDLLRMGAPGVAVTEDSNLKGNSSMMIRGKGSISAGTSPLIVLDGFIYRGQMSDINTADIEQIDVLKDASALAVFGSQAANGVILVTTKKGPKNAKSMINFSSTMGFAFKNSLPEVYKGNEYVTYRQAVLESMYPTEPKEYYSNPANLSDSGLSNWMLGAAGNPTDVWLSRLEFSNVEIDNYKAGRMVDWEDLTYNKVAIRQDYTVSVSGRKDDISFYSSLNYVKRENNIKRSAYDAVRARMNLQSKARKDITYGVNAQFATRNEGYVGVSGNGYQTNSPFGDVYELNGKLKLYPNDNSNAINPLIGAEYTDRLHEINNINASLFLKFEFPLGFVFQTTYSPRYEWVNYLNHYSSEYPKYAKENGEASRMQTKDFLWQWDNTLKWNKEFGKNSFDFTFLANWEKFRRWNNTMTNRMFLPNDDLGYGAIELGTSPTVDSNDTYRTSDGLMGRLHYSFNRRYLITSSLRRDGFSAFGINNKRVLLPSLALGWEFTQETFSKKIKWLDYGKLRLSWGKNGSRDIDPYAALMKLTTRKYFYVNSDTGELVHINGVFASNMANPNLKWESSSTLNFGLDFSLFSDKLSGSLDLYKRKSNDLLNDRQLPTTTGYTNVISNIGEVQNVGVELLLNSNNIKNNDFSWTTSLSFTHNNNTIKHLYGLMEDVKDQNGNVIGQQEAGDIIKGYFIGHALDEIWGYKQIGVWQLSEAAEAQKYGQSPGDMKILDVDKNYRFDNNDKVFQGNLTPKYRLSMRNEFAFLKHFTASFNLYAYLGHMGVYDRAKNDDALLNLTNQIKTNYWTPNNPTSEYARLKAARPAGIDFSVYRKLDFVRLDNVSVGYSVPKAMLDKLKIESLSFTLSVKNAAYFAPHWPAEDPENTDKNTPRIVFMGINMTI